MSMDVVAFGEILWDVIDGVPHIGGAPFNFAAHAARCGLKSAIVSAVGDDGLGRRARTEAERLGVDVSMVGVHPNLPTGTVNVTLADGIPSYEIVRPVAWDEITGDAAAWGHAALPCNDGGHAALPCNDGRAGSPLPAVDVPRAFYFGTLAQRSPVSAATLGSLLDACASSLAFSAAFLAAVLHGESLASAAEAGNRLAGKVAARAGARPEDL